MSDEAPTWPRRLQSAAGLVFQVNANGSIRRIEHGDVVVNLFPGSEIEGGPTNLYLRVLGSEIAWTPLLGPRSPLVFQTDGRGLRAAGEWKGLRVNIALVLAESATAWFWHVGVENRGGEAALVDLVYAQDLALAPYGAIRMNEYYVSQYLDHVPLEHAARGFAVATRQNLAVGGCHPWSVIGSLRRGASFATDALQLHGFTTRAGDTPAGLAVRSLPGVRHQHEHAMAVIQQEATQLAAGARADLGFFGWFEADHPAATSNADLDAVDRALSLPEAKTPAPEIALENGAAPARTLFSSAPPLRCRDLTAAEISRFWGDDLCHVEREDGDLLSFFTPAHAHVVLAAKERRVLRPHGEILRTGAELAPEEASLTTTVWMAGVFNCLLTQGHVSINRFLSTTRSYLGLQRAHGQRLFVETMNGELVLLEVPSAWEIRPSSCRWLYAYDGGLIEVSLKAGVTQHTLQLRVEVLDGPPTRFLLSNHVALNGDDGAEAVPVRFTRRGASIRVKAIPDSDVGRRFPDGDYRIDAERGTRVERVADDAPLFADGVSRAQPFLTVLTAPAKSAAFRIRGGLLGAPPRKRDAAGSAKRFWSGMSVPLSVPSSAASGAEAKRLETILPWFAHDALIHYLAPRGLEQYSGGGWGTRDVTQGPVELLLALGEWKPLRELLLLVFANQNPDGDWPQWFMFFDRERGIRPNESHGDIVFWPPHALAEYLLAAEDASILDAEVPYFHPEGDAAAERGTVWSHVERAIALAKARVIPGTQLEAYGHGDWNDSLQPADPSMRERLCSTWTVILHHETLTKLARALRRFGRDAKAAPLEAEAGAIRADLMRHLLADGELAGLAYFHPDGRIDHLLHPRDRDTGIHHRLLPMIHAIIADLLTPEQAAAHIEVMRTRLVGADGARLFDASPPYRGGPQRHFQRAESSSFFGREIGLMYTHAHLRYAEAMARHGDAEACFEALRRAHPIAIRSVVGAARLRQANCYFSSSDAVVADRYEAASRYDEIRAGKLPLEGGWRVYSSGAGIAFRLVHQCFLGLRRGNTVLGIDPMIPKSLDGLAAEIELEGRRVSVRYRVAARGYGPRAVSLNGEPLLLTRLTNPYRTAGVTVPMSAVRTLLRPRRNSLVVELE